MNKQALDELRDKCHKCIEAWKIENWRKPLDIELGDFVEHCCMYGDDDIKELYDEVWEDSDEDDPDIQKALWKVERHLFMLNLDDDGAEPEDRMSTEQMERIYIGKRVAMLRVERGMSQKELAEKAGIKPGNVLRIETGKYNIGLDILSKVAKALNIEFDFVD